MSIHLNEYNNRSILFQCKLLLETCWYWFAKLPRGILHVRPQVCIHIYGQIMTYKIMKIPNKARWEKTVQHPDKAVSLRFGKYCRIHWGWWVRCFFTGWVEGSGVPRLWLSWRSKEGEAHELGIVMWNVPRSHHPYHVYPSLWHGW